MHEIPRLAYNCGQISILHNLNKQTNKVQGRHIKILGGGKGQMSTRGGEAPPHYSIQAIVFENRSTLILPLEQY